MTRKLKVSIVTSRDSEYTNKVNAEDHKQIALVLLDWKSLNIPIEKAIKEYKLLKKSDFDYIVGN